MHTVSQPKKQRTDLTSPAFATLTASSESAAAPAPAIAASTAPEVVVSHYTLPTHMHTFPITISPLSSTLTRNSTYGDLHISLGFEHRLAKFGLLQPTPIQCAAIPYLTHHPTVVSPTHQHHPPDLLITDEPGTGKTLAYALPLLSQVNPYLHALQAVVVVPSRGLAVQLAKVMNELNVGGRKARQRNPVRIEMCAAAVATEGLIAHISQPRPQPKLPNIPSRSTSSGSSKQYNAGRQNDEEEAEDESYADENGGEDEEEAGVPVGRVTVPSDFVAAHAEDDGLLLGSSVAQVLIGTPHVLHDLLVKRELLDCRELKYIVVDEADVLLVKETEGQLLTELLALRNKPQLSSPFKATSSTSLPFNTSLATTTTPLSLSPPAATQVALVSSIITLDMLRFAARQLSQHRHVLTPASVPHVTRGHRTLISRIVNVPTKNNAQRTVLAQQLHLRWQISHHYALIPQHTDQSQKAQMLLQLLLAIRSAMRHSSPVRGQPQWVRHTGSRLKSGVAGVPPLSDRLPQTTLVVFHKSDHIYPTLSLLSSHLRIAMLTSNSSRTEVRDALSITPPPEVILATDNELLGLDLKAVSHVVNYSVARNLSTPVYYRRAGRCGRRGAVWSHGRVITMCKEGTDELEKVERVAAATGAKGVTQVVVRGEKLYERGAARLERMVRQQRQQKHEQEQELRDEENDEREMTAKNAPPGERLSEEEERTVQQRLSREPPPARYLDSLLGTTKRSTRART